MDTHENSTKGDHGTDWEEQLREKVRAPLEAVQKQATEKIRGLGELIARHPGASLAAAFVIGFGIARVLQKRS